MIELRWLVKTEILEYCADGSTIGQEVKVLQYLKPSPLVGEDGEWIDVPEVRE